MVVLVLTKTAIQDHGSVLFVLIYFFSFSFVPEEVLMICLNTVHR